MDITSLQEQIRHFYSTISPRHLWSAIAALVVVYLARRLWFSGRLPPGPWGLPIFGYWLFLSNATSRDFIKLEEKYGRIFGLYLGSQYVVILGEFKDIKEAYNKEEFTDRPQGWLQLTPKYSHLADMSGWEWKENRKVVVTALRHLGIGKNRVEDVVKEQIRRMFEKLDELGPSAEVQLEELFNLPLINIIFVLICGKTVEDNAELLATLKEFSGEALDTLTTNQTTIFYPYLKYITGVKNYLWSKKEGAADQMYNFVRKEMETHEKDLDENKEDDFIDLLLKQMKKLSKSNERTSLTRKNANGNAQALIFGGVDTVRAVSSWLFLYLANYQEAQEKIYNEITNLLGKEKAPSWSDKDNLPYTIAFISEVTRMAHVGPAADAHWCSKGGVIRGYTIPKNTLILANLRSVNEDKALWGDPENFRPERFISADGKKAVIPEYWMLFLTGKRSCPGDKLANMQLFLFVASFVQKYRVTAPPSGLTLKEIEMVLVLPVKPVVSFELRS